MMAIKSIWLSSYGGEWIHFGHHLLVVIESILIVIWQGQENPTGANEFHCHLVRTFLFLIFPFSPFGFFPLVIWFGWGGGGGGGGGRGGGGGGGGCCGFFFSLFPVWFFSPFFLVPLAPPPPPLVLFVLSPFTFCFVFICFCPPPITTKVGCISLT
jgi:hypothetical protein